MKVPITASEVEAAKQAQERRAADRKTKRKAVGKRAPDNETPSLDGEIVDWMTYVNNFDIVITTFQVLQTDLTVARTPIKRPRRATVLDAYSSTTRPRSPLIMVEWARVIMDEVQLMGDGRAAEMMSLIPRVSSLAVSGTPAKKSVADLQAVLKYDITFPSWNVIDRMNRFLRADDEITQAKNWKRILCSGFSDIFTKILKESSIRTLKSQVQHELTIPTQRRYVVGVPMGRVEKHVGDLKLFNSWDPWFLSGLRGDAAICVERTRPRCSGGCASNRMGIGHLPPAYDDPTAPSYCDPPPDRPTRRTRKDSRRWREVEEHSGRSQSLYNHFFRMGVVFTS